MWKIIALALFAILFSTPIFARSCDDDSISSVSNDGSIIVMLSGAVYEVDAGDQVDTMLWLPAESVLVCGGTLINTDENGEKASVVRLK